MSHLIQAIIFDLDGVIINSNPAIEAFWKSWTDKENIVLTDALIRQWIHGRKVGDTLDGLFGHLTENKHSEIRESAYHFDQDMNPGPIQGIYSFVTAINQLSLPVGIVTSSHQERMMDMLVRIAMQNHFMHFVTAHDVTKGKPHPEPYLAMSNKLNIAPEQCLVFEDAISGIQSATAAGMLSVGIGDEQAKTALQQFGASDVIPDFTNIHIHQRTFTTSNGIVFSAE